MTMTFRIIDAHTHTQFPEYDTDRDEVIRRALDAGIGMVNVGTDAEMSREEGVWATIGIHPTDAQIYADDTQMNADIKKLELLALDKKVVGIGECGLDYFRLENLHEADPRRKQKELFTAQIELAHRVGKPLVLHVRPSAGSTDAFEDVLDILNNHKELLTRKNPGIPGISSSAQSCGFQPKAEDADVVLPGICHFFTGTKEIAEKFLDLNFSFTFGGLITYNREFDEVLECISADHLLVETDAPFVAPKSHRGHRNEPAYVAEVAEFLGDFKKIPQKMFLENTKHVFKLLL